MLIIGSSVTAIYPLKTKHKALSKGRDEFIEGKLEKGSWPGVLCEYANAFPFPLANRRIFG